MMYVRFPLSLRNVEDLLHERGIDISYETVRFWWNRFGPLFASRIRKNRAAAYRHQSEWRWHLDEVFVRINGETFYLWRAVDHEGEVLESFVTKKRDRKAALKFCAIQWNTTTNRMRLWRTNSVPIALRWRSSAMPPGRKRVAGSITGPKILTCRFDDGNGQCRAFDRCEVYRNSHRFMHQFTTISTRNVISTVGKTLNATDLSLWQSGGNLQPKMRQYRTLLVL